MEPEDDVLDEEVLDELVEAVSFLPESPDGFADDDAVLDVVVDEPDERLSVR
ncbi:hypothetical protein AB0O28_24115 [Microbispora sp. NPDC088329]|uniref:hypothetical protein n=1 Tax=Microbispora sp. NPDC088329 TaxID=3154869 RepID=UPI003431EF5F